MKETQSTKPAHPLVIVRVFSTRSNPFHSIHLHFQSNQSTYRFINPSSSTRNLPPIQGRIPLPEKRTLRNEFTVIGIKPRILRLATAFWLPVDIVQSIDNETTYHFNDTTSLLSVISDVFSLTFRTTQSTFKPCQSWKDFIEAMSFLTSATARQLAQISGEETPQSTFDFIAKTPHPPEEPRPSTTSTQPPPRTRRHHRVPSLSLPPEDIEVTYPLPSSDRSALSERSTASKHSSPPVSFTRLEDYFGNFGSTVFKPYQQPPPEPRHEKSTRYEKISRLPPRRP